MKQIPVEVWHCFQLKSKKGDWTVSYFYWNTLLPYTSPGILSYFKKKLLQNAFQKENSKHCKLKTLFQKTQKHCLKKYWSSVKTRMPSGIMSRLASPTARCVDVHEIVFLRGIKKFDQNLKSIQNGPEMLKKTKVKDFFGEKKMGCKKT